MIWVTVIFWSHFCWLYRASPSLAMKNIINLILVLTIWLYSCVESSFVLLEEFLLISTFSWQNSVIFCPASFCTPRPNLLVTPSISWPAFAFHGLNSQSYIFSSSHVWMWELDRKEGWAPKNWCFGIMVLEKTLESPLNCKEIKPVNLKGNQPWIFTGKTDAKAEAPILWPPDAKSNSLEKTLMLGKIEGRRRRGTTEDEMVGWHHWLNGHEFEQPLGDGEGQGSLACCSPWVRKEWDTTEQLNWTEIEGSRENTGEGNGNPLQYSCLENPTGGGAW